MSLKRFKGRSLQYPTMTAKSISLFVKGSSLVKSIKPNAAGNNDYVDYGIRMAKAFSPKLAMKANFTYLKVQIGMNYDDKTELDSIEKR
jgi:hypothetical protein